MFSIGMDIASDGFVACVYGASGVRAQGRFAVQGEWERAFGAWLHQQGVSGDEAWLVVENTGVYSAQVCYPLHEAGYRIALVSPLQVRDGFRLRKTDEVDACRLAEYGYRFADKLERWQPRAERVEQVRVRLMERSHYRDMAQELRNVLLMLRRHPVPSGCTISRLEQTIEALERRVREVEEEIEELVAEDERLREGCAIVRSVVGCGVVVSWQLLVVPEGFTRVPSARALCSYLGIAPHERRSGRRVRYGSHSRGYGPGELRRVLHLAALTAVRVGGELQVYYRRKIGEGKSVLMALNAVKNKILHRVCACLRDWRHYQREYARGAVA